MLGRDHERALGAGSSMRIEFIEESGRPLKGGRRERRRDLPAP